MPPLSVLIWIPAAFGVLAAALPRLLLAISPPADSERRAKRARALPGIIGATGAIVALGLTIGYIVEFKGGVGSLHLGAQHLTHVTDVTWIAPLGIHYKLGLDGLNVLLIGLTALMFASAVLASHVRTERSSFPHAGLYYLFLLVSESAVLGAFLVQDLILFVAFFDLMLIPFYFITGMWGAGDRKQRTNATLKLVIYTLVGSLLMLAAAIATGVLASQQHGTPLTFAYSSLVHLPLSQGSQEWIFLFFTAAFFVKMPAFPLHGWMPDVYSTMPIESLMAFSGVLAKVGAYGFLAILLPLFPQASVHFQMLMLLIGLVSILYGTAIAFVHTDARMIASYSSIAQLGFITIGIFSLTSKGAQGAMLQIVNHGLVVAALMFIVLVLSRRAGGSEDIRDMGGLAMRAPIFASLFLIVALATLAMPGSANFVGEFLILIGVFGTKLAIAIIGFVGVIGASVYALRLFIRSMHNRLGSAAQTREMSARDGLALLPLVAAIVFLALYPQSALQRSESSTAAAIASPAKVAHAPSTPARAKPPAALPTAEAQR